MDVDITDEVITYDDGDKIINEDEVFYVDVRFVSKDIRQECIELPHEQRP